MAAEVIRRDVRATIAIEWNTSKGQEWIPIKSHARGCNRIGRGVFSIRCW